MNRQYTKHVYDFGVVISFEENGETISFSETPGNRHYEEYLEWLAEGNTPEGIEGS